MDGPLTGGALDGPAPGGHDGAGGADEEAGGAADAADAGFVAALGPMPGGNMKSSGFASLTAGFSGTIRAGNLNSPAGFPGALGGAAVVGGAFVGGAVAAGLFGAGFGAFKLPGGSGGADVAGGSGGFDQREVAGGGAGPSSGEFGDTEPGGMALTGIGPGGGANAAGEGGMKLGGAGGLLTGGS